jgi:hypothetical protein
LTGEEEPNFDSVLPGMLASKFEALTKIRFPGLPCGKFFASFADDIYERAELA